MQLQGHLHHKQLRIRMSMPWKFVARLAALLPKPNLSNATRLGQFVHQFFLPAFLLDSHLRHLLLR